MSPNHLRRRLLTYCQRRLTDLVASDVAKLETYICRLIDDRQSPPQRRSSLDWSSIAIESAISVDRLHAHRVSIAPALEAIARAATAWTPAEIPKNPRPTRIEYDHPAPNTDLGPFAEVKPVSAPSPAHQFSNRLDSLMRSNGDNSTTLHSALVERGVCIEQSTLISWRNGSKAPRAAESFRALKEIEQHLNAAQGELTALLPHRGRAAIGLRIEGVSVAEMRRLSWHLPNDFPYRSKAEQAEILDWVRTVIVAGATDYRRYQAAASRQRFGFRFIEMADAADFAAQERLRRSDLRAPDQLQAEMTELVAFKTATLTKRGYRRNGVWGPDTADQKIEHLGLMFGAMAADEGGPLRGLGARKDSLSLGLLIFPAVWDWYLGWRSAKRGFFTSWESEMLGVAIGLSRRETGWIRQTPALAMAIQPIPELVTIEDIELARSNWDAACDAFHDFGVARARELQRIARVH